MNQLRVSCEAFPLASVFCLEKCVACLQVDELACELGIPFDWRDLE
jgi:hypothetical protein